MKPLSVAKITLFFERPKPLTTIMPDDKAEHPLNSPSMLRDDKTPPSEARQLREALGEGTPDIIPSRAIITITDTDTCCSSCCVFK